PHASGFAASLPPVGAEFDARGPSRLMARVCWESRVVMAAPRRFGTIACTCQYRRGLAFIPLHATKAPAGAFARKGVANGYCVGPSRARLATNELSPSRLTSETGDPVISAAR